MIAKFLVDPVDILILHLLKHEIFARNILNTF